MGLSVASDEEVGIVGSVEEDPSLEEDGKIGGDTSEVNGDTPIIPSAEIASRAPRGGHDESLSSGGRVMSPTTGFAVAFS